MLLPSEDGEALEAFAAGLFADFEPTGALETDLALRVVTCAWRLRRVRAVESVLFQDGSYGPGTPSQAWVSDCVHAECFTKLSRYEAAIERSFYRALHELQRLQAVRRGQHVPAPVAVDVTIANGE